MGNRFFFGAANATGPELWATDGSRAGTVRIAPFPAARLWTPLVRSGNRLFFAAGNDDSNRSRAYAYDGTRIHSLGLPQHGVTQLTSLEGGRVAFTSRLDRELFLSDGTTNGTQRLDLVPGSVDSNPRGLTSIPGGGAAFVAELPNGDAVNWVTLGSARTTRVLFDLEPGLRTGDSAPYIAFGNRARNGNRLLFATEEAATADLYQLAHGRVTRLGTALLPGDARAGIAEIQRAGQQLAIFEAGTFPTGWEPWVTDGTAAGTRMLRDIAPNQKSSIRESIVSLGDRAVFAATDPTHGHELWVTDGSAAGTVLLRDIYPGRIGSRPTDLVRFGDRVVFVASGPRGSALWVTNGTASGTRPWIANAPRHQSEPVHLRVWRDTLYYCADAGLWQTDGTTAGTNQAMDLPRGHSTEHVFVTPEQLVVFTRGPAVCQLHSFTPTRTGPIATLQPEARIRRAATSGSRLYVSISEHSFGSELMVIDRQTARRVADLNPGQGNSEPEGLLAAGDGGLYFSAFTPQHGRELFYTDGTTLGTRLVAELRPGPADGMIGGLAWVGDDLVFPGNSPQYGRELFRLRQPARAHAFRIRHGCGILAADRLSTHSPQMGRTTVIRGHWPHSVRSGVLVLGMPTALPTALPSSPGCGIALDTSAPVWPIAQLTGTDWFVPLTIPNAPGLNGHSVVVQGITTSRPQLVVTDALRLVVGR